MTPSEPLARPVAGPVAGPATGPAARPATGPAARPATGPARGPDPTTAAAPSSSTQDRAAAAARALADALARTPPPPDPAVIDREPDPHDVARQIVLRQLAVAPRSRAQLARKLQQRGCDPEVAGTVLDRMTEVGLVDDQAYADLLVRSQQATRGLARAALAQRLRTDGVDDDLVKDAVAGIDDAHERDQARALVGKRLRTMHGLPREVQARRLGAMLARKGYPAGLSWSVVRDALAESPEHLRD